MIERLVVFGATGDLAGRYLLPALGALQQAGALPPGFEVVGSARDDLSDEGFGQLAAQRLDEHAPDLSAAARSALVAALRYRPVDLDDTDSVAAAVAPDRGPVAVYLALPPATFATAVTSLATIGLPAGSRVVLEKPFGEDLPSAVALNDLIVETLGEESVFRVDHVLGLPTVHNLLSARLANRVLEPLWNSSHIEQVDILWDETLALEGRAGYYDGAGALKDVIQNHLLQVLCVLAMEPPASRAGEALRDAKVEVLRSVRSLGPAEAASRTTRARYTAGTLAPPPSGAGVDIPAYVDEDGVDTEQQTETFAELVLELDSPRWSGTRFLLRTGKALGRRHKGVIVRFRPASGLPFGPDSAPPPNELHIGLDGPETVALHLTGSAPGPPAVLVPLVLGTEPPAEQLPAYSHVLLGILEDDTTLSVRGDEAEMSWRVVTPFLEAWASGRVPMQEYPAGSDGPPSRLGP